VSIIRQAASANTIDEAERAVWQALATAIISDELNRTGTMVWDLKPLAPPGTVLVGPALTVRTMVGDNLAIHHAVAEAPAGVVLVIDAGGPGPNAVWGGVLHKAAELRGIAGVIVDGCVRDTAEIRASPVPCFARGTVPAGPQKAWGGEINATISAGGCTVAPGDLVVADEDGVVVVPFDTRSDVLANAKDRMKNEQTIVERLEAGETTVQIFGLQG